MQPAFFNGGQHLEKTHYHVDACLWKEETFIDGATFLMPTKLPQAGLENYSVDLDNTTGVYHITLRHVPLRASLALTNLSTPNFSSHFVEFSSGKMATVPRMSFARDTMKGDAQKSLTREQDKPKAQPEPDRHHSAEDQPKVLLSGGTSSAPAGTDSAITEFGRVVSEQAAKGQPSPSSFSKSVIHILPWGATGTTSTEVEDSDACAQAQEPAPIAVIDTQPSGKSNSSRRSSGGSQRTGFSTSTVATSPTSSDFSTVPFEKSALKDLPTVPFVPGKPTAVVKALALEDANQSNPGKSGDPDCISSWDLSISHRQVRHWYMIQDGNSPCLGGRPPHNNELVVTEEGNINRTETDVRAV